jgi:succinate dehydrogenase / fumarate reductase membrane anchor subunit
VSGATGHFIAQRVSAVALVFLGLWFAVSIGGLHSSSHEIAVAFVAKPLNAVLLALMCVTLAYHSFLGVQVVIDDYVHAPRLNSVAQRLSRVAHGVLALLCVYAVWTIGFGA